MPSQTFTIVVGKNDGLVISPTELIEIYFFGTPLTEEDGKFMPEHVIRMYIKSAQDEIEGYINHKLLKQIVTETRDYNRQEYWDWGFIRTNSPVNKVESIVGKISDVSQIVYPKEWYSVRQSSDGISNYRNIYIVPASQGMAQYTGMTAQIGFLGVSSIPQYWHLKYCTGFNRVPDDLINIIGKLAAINIFHILGDIILGAGIASQSIGIDGLSQSISTTSSATNAGYGARITGYLGDLKRQMPLIKAKYDGFEMNSM